MTWEAWFTLAVVVIILVAPCATSWAPAARWWADGGGAGRRDRHPEEPSPGRNPAPITVAALFAGPRRREDGSAHPGGSYDTRCHGRDAALVGPLGLPHHQRLGLSSTHADRRHAVAPGGEVGRGAGARLLVPHAALLCRTAGRRGHRDRDPDQHRRVGLLENAGQPPIGSSRSPGSGCRSRLVWVLLVLLALRLLKVRRSVRQEAEDDAKRFVLDMVVDESVPRRPGGRSRWAPPPQGVSSPPRPRG